MLVLSHIDAKSVRQRLLLLQACHAIKESVEKRFYVRIVDWSFQVEHSLQITSEVYMLYCLMFVVVVKVLNGDQAYQGIKRIVRFTSNPWGYRFLMTKVISMDYGKVKLQLLNLPLK